MVILQRIIIGKKQIKLKNADCNFEPSTFLIATSKVNLVYISLKVTPAGISNILESTEPS